MLHLAEGTFWNDKEENTFTSGFVEDAMMSSILMLLKK